MKKCFFITPIGDKESETYYKMSALKKNVLEPLLKDKDYEIEAAHEIKETGSISRQIVQRIFDADLIIVNVTGLNPNVMYEAAIAHSFGKPTIMVCERTTRLPFDIIEQRTLFYDDTIKGSGELVSELNEMLNHLETSGTYNNPVYDVVQQTQLIENTKLENGEESLTNKAILDMQFKLDVLFKQISRNEEADENKIFIDIDSSRIRRSFKCTNGRAILTGREDDEVFEAISDIFTNRPSATSPLPSYDEIANELGIGQKTLRRYLNYKYKF